MTLGLIKYVFLGVAALPFIYYLIALYSSWRFFSKRPDQIQFTPSVSILKPIRGLDPEAYENFASFCRLDYPDYEILFCVGKRDDPALPVLQELARNFPERRIRILFEEGGRVTNDKIAKLLNLLGEAQHEVIVMADSDVRVRPDYLGVVVAPLANPKVGATTCFYMPVENRTLAEGLQAIGMASDFYAGILVSRQLEGVKFALGPTIVTRKANLAEFGGLQVIENFSADDLLIGRMIADRGHEVVLLPYVVRKLAGHQSVGNVWSKWSRWMVVMRHTRPWGFLGLLLTKGLPWSLVAIAIHPSLGVALGYLGTYLTLRFSIGWSIGIRGLKQPQVWKKIPLIPLWDAFAFMIWLASSFRRTIRWRDGEYYIRGGKLCPVNSGPAQK
jgi:ceramide glucosyltransferase